MRILCLLILCFGTPLFSQVVVTVPPIKYLVERVAGDLLEVQTLVPAGADLHTYEPPPRDVERIQEARVWFRIGEPIEKRPLAAVKTHNPQMLVVDLCDGIALLPGSKGCAHCDGGDRHIWMSLCIDQALAHVITETLSKAYPQHKENFETNRDYLLDDLETLDEQMKKQLASCKGETILVSHPAFGYFCRDYSLVQLPIEQDGREPSPRQLRAIIEQARKAKVETIIVQPRVSNKGAFLLAYELDIQTCRVDPLEEDLPTLFHQLANCICPK